MAGMSESRADDRRLGEGDSVALLKGPRGTASSTQWDKCGSPA